MFWYIKWLYKLLIVLYLNKIHNFNLISLFSDYYRKLLYGIIRYICRQTISVKLQT